MESSKKHEQYAQASKNNSFNNVTHDATKPLISLIWMFFDAATIKSKKSVFIKWDDDFGVKLWLVYGINEKEMGVKDEITNDARSTLVLSYYIRIMHIPHFLWAWWLCCATIKIVEGFDINTLTLCIIQNKPINLLNDSIINHPPHHCLIHIHKVIH